MNGPGHYRAAEILMATLPDGLPAEDRANLLAAAQVHATLALSAATLDGAFEVDNAKDWLEVIR